MLCHERTIERRLLLPAAERAASSRWLVGKLYHKHGDSFPGARAPQGPKHCLPQLQSYAQTSSVRYKSVPRTVAMASRVLVLAAILGCLGLGAHGQGLTTLLTDPELAPAVDLVLANPPLEAELLSSPVLTALLADGPVASELLASPVLIELLDNETTLEVIAESPQLADLLEGNPNVVLPPLAAAAEAPATGNAEADLLTLEANLLSTLEAVLAPAPAQGSARKLLRA